MSVTAEIAEPRYEFRVDPHQMNAFRPTFWAKFDPEGKLTYFDSELMRDFAHRSLDAAIVSGILEAAASKVDHIPCEGGGTYGDTIRNLTIEE